MKKRGRSEAPVTCVVRVSGQIGLFVLEIIKTVKAAAEVAYQKASMETDYQRTFLSFCFQIFWHQDVDANRMLIDDFVAGAVNMERGELF